MIKRLILSLLVVVAAAVVVSVRVLAGAPAASADPLDPYDPATYGVPPVLAGYEVLVVLTSETTACLPEGMKRMFLQATQASMDEFLKESQPQSLEQAIAANGLGDIKDWSIAFSGPGITRESIIAENESWNAIFQGQECPTLGGPIQIATDQP